MFLLVISEYMQNNLSSTVSPCYFGSFHAQICTQRGSRTVISLVRTRCSTDSWLLCIEATVALKESTCAACKHFNKEVLQCCWHDLMCTRHYIDFCWLICVALKDMAIAQELQQGVLEMLWKCNTVNMQDINTVNI